MNDEIAGGERARFGQNVLGAAPALRLPYETVAENVLLADDGEVRRFEPLFERDDSERQRASARCRRLMIGRYELEWFEAMLGQHVTQPLARTVAPASDDHVQAPLAQRPHMGDRGVEHIGALVLPFGSKIAPCPSAAIDDVDCARLRLEWRKPRYRLRWRAGPSTRLRSDKAALAAAAYSPPYRDLPRKPRGVLHNCR